MLLPDFQQLGHRVPLRLVQGKAIGNVPTRDHQAVPLCHGVRIRDADRQFVFEQHPATALQFAKHTAFLAVAVAGLYAAEVSGVRVALTGIAAEAQRLQVADVA